MSSDNRLVVTGHCELCGDWGPMFFSIHTGQWGGTMCLRHIRMYGMPEGYDVRVKE